MLQAGKVAVSRLDEVNEVFFSFYLILPAASNRNEYQEHKNNVTVE
jgi:hypothetical protein